MENNFRAEFDGKSNLGYCYRIYKRNGNSYIFVGSIFAKKQDEDYAIKIYEEEETSND